MLLLFVVSLVTVLMRGMEAEIFTAIVDMENLLSTESEILVMMGRYIQAEEKRLFTLKSYMAEFQKLHSEAREDGQSYLQNPINAYLLVKRLTADWKKVETVMVENVAKKYLENITSNDMDIKFPNDEDLNGAAVALMRLQDTYKLETSALASGEILGTRISHQLSAGDCFELGRQSYNNADYYHTVSWMGESLKRLGHEFNGTADRAEILEYLAFSIYMQGDVAEALRMTIELLELLPNHTRALGNKAYYEESLKKTAPQKRKGDDGYVEGEKEENLAQENTSLESVPEEKEIPERKMYEMLCRGEKTLPHSVQARLKCRYFSNNHPFLLLQPIKEEEAYLEPRIVIYHNVVYDSETDIVKEMSQPRLKRATVQNYKTGELETAQYRISKSAWLRNEEDIRISNINDRIEQLTGLNMDTAEELQVVNYGIGGHYEPHFDFARREEKHAFSSLGTGNRMATFLMYMSEVPAGGATVFTAIGVTIYPRKGSAAFWYNLHPDGEGDYLTRHAACPVLTGSKWVSNKWIHERGQEFRRPCALSQNTY